jgi:hypothetical protein
MGARARNHIFFFFFFFFFFFCQSTCFNFFFFFLCAYPPKLRTTPFPFRAPTLEHDLDALAGNHDHGRVDTGEEARVGVLHDRERPLADAKDGALQGLPVRVAEEAQRVQRRNTAAIVTWGGRTHSIIGYGTKKRGGAQLCQFLSFFRSFFLFFFFFFFLRAN